MPRQPFFKSKEPQNIYHSLFIHAYQGSANFVIQLLDQHKDLPIDFFNRQKFSKYPNNVSLLRILMLNLSKKPKFLSKMMSLLELNPLTKDSYYDLALGFGTCIYDIVSTNPLLTPKEKQTATECACALKTFIETKQSSDRPLSSLQTPLEVCHSSITEAQLFQHHFSSFPLEEMWRLFCDGQLQKPEWGWNGYISQEPHFLSAMATGMVLLETTLEETLSASLIERIHTACTHGVVEANSGRVICPAESGQQGYRHRANMCFGLPEENTTQSGLCELMSASVAATDGYRLVTKGNGCLLDVDSDQDEEVLWVQQDLADREIILERVNRCIQCYHDNMASADTPEKKLRVIATLVLTLERIHPFYDGNCRTICILILNRELMLNGFSPAILENPNRFDGFGCDDCVVEIRKGIHHFLAVKAGNLSYFGPSTQEILDQYPASNEAFYSCTAILKNISCFRDSPQMKTSFTP